MKKIAAFVAFAVLLLAAASFAKDKDTYSELKFLVVRDSSQKPVPNAAVVLHPVDKDGHQGKGGIELKTDLEGRTSFGGIPFGKMRVQVIAHGLQTFGQDYDINQPQQEIVIKLKPPQKQYSIYK